VLADSAAGPAAAHYNRLGVFSIPASNFLCCVRPVDVSAGHFDLLSTVFPTAVAEIEGHSDLATIPFLVTGAEVKWAFVFVNVNPPMAVDCCCCLAGTDFPANDLFLTLHILG